MSATQHELDRVRHRIADLKAKREAVANAAVTRAEAEAAARTYVRTAAERFRPTVGSFVERARPVSNVRDELGHDPEAVLAALAGDRLEAILLQRVAEAYEQHGPGLTAAERAAELARIDADLFDLECQEEALCRAAEAAGQEIDRRPDADPRAVLARAV
jgi:hypothetical protein